jgi:hypothetical protein
MIENINCVAQIILIVKDAEGLPKEDSHSLDC